MHIESRQICRRKNPRSIKINNRINITIVKCTRIHASARAQKINYQYESISANKHIMEISVITKALIT